MNRISLNIIEETNEHDDEIAIVGISGVFPNANDLSDLWTIYSNSVDCVREFPNERKIEIDKYLRKFKKINKPEYYESAFLQQIDYFDYEFFNISPSEANNMDPNQRIFLQVAWKALEDANIQPTSLSNTNTGVFLGFTGAKNSSYFDMIKDISPDSLAVNLPGNTPAIIASRISYLLDLKGPSITIDTTCSSSLVALHYACNAIRQKDCDVAIIGGININILPVKSDHKMGIESSTGRTKSFDENSDGTGGGEGAAAIVVKPLKKAIADQDFIYSIIKGSAVNHDGKSIGLTAPNPNAQEQVILKAWENSDIDPTTITYVESHGTGTKLGDPIEIQALSQAFKRYTDQKQFCAIGAAKSNIGHLNDAAGIAGLIKAVLSLQHKKLFPINHLVEPNKKIQFENTALYLTRELSHWERIDENTPLRCGVSSFGLSGTNCHVVLEEYISSSEGNVSKDTSYVLTFSAKYEEGLDKLVQQYDKLINENKEIRLCDLCYTSNLYRVHHEHRVAIICNSIQQLRETLGQLKSIVPRRYKEFSNVFYDGKCDLLQENRSPGSSIEAAQSYVEGYQISWRKMYSTNVKKVRIPTYQFKETKCWIANREKSNDCSDLFNVTHWVEDSLKESEESEYNKKKLIFYTDLNDKLCNKLIEREENSLFIRINTNRSDLSIDELSINGTEEEFGKLLDKLNRIDYEKILLVISEAHESRPDIEKIMYAFYRLMKAVIRKDRNQELEIYVVSPSTNEVTGTENNLYPEYSALQGMTKVISQEYQNLSLKFIDTDELTSIDSVLREINSPIRENLVAFRNDIRFVRILTSTVFDKTIIDPLDDDGVYIVTGGNKGIGHEITKKMLSLNHNLNIAVISKSGRNESNYLEGVEYYKCDVTDYGLMNNLFSDLREKYGKINGVIHGAGLPGSGLLHNKSEEEFSRVVAPKIEGTYIIEKVTQNDDLDFLILFSSASTLQGAPGQLDYIAANCFLESYSDYRNKTNNRTMCVMWSGWKETGMAFDHNVEEGGLFQFLSTKEGTDAFEYLLNCKEPKNVIVGRLNYSEDSKLYIDRIYSEEVVENETENIFDRNVKLNGREGDQYTSLEYQIALIWGEVLGVDEVDVNISFFDIGGHSLLAIKMEVEFEKQGLMLSATDVEEMETIAEMANYLQHNLINKGEVSSLK
ncbi:SDR family NAD(P)-dependent oxidoreductase [Paenibacillus illinoisensis]|uniref:SDR family NAD(P)-dependent oxidoreductase n=1 Tax=Paenibacillus illinoisensis TaxID=59845 RepID=UPI001C8DCC47|nr:SDR family NAD(P)-dependent oxidoreductase [Paenibacillus illinoisensis]MBY0217733.1 SDR family NAD(P)-dependent oxidoreductase [Paenibacillus illinoisensis]